VHRSAACLWLGGLVLRGLVVWPLARFLRRTAFLRYARLAPVLIALIVTAGVYLSVLRLPHVSDLWQETYGRVLLVKLSLVCVALGWGGLHHLVGGWLVKRDHPRTGLLSRSLLGEATVGMAVLLAAAVLVDSKPPPQPAPVPGQAVSVGR
jgi:putative copper export protein